jgi:hypothetical protein
MKRILSSTCKFCGLPKPLVKAHIVPLSLYPRNPNKDRRLKVMSVKGERPPSDLRNGYFDENLVCRDCENYFDPYDAYAARFFKGLLSHPLLTTPDGLRYREVTDYNRRKLKLFFLSLLWRSHATSLAAFKQVQLGPYAESVKKMIQQGDPGPDELFSIVLMTFRPENDPMLDLSNIALSPIARKIDGVRIYEFWLFSCVAWVPVGQKPIGPPLAHASIAAGSSLKIIERPAQDSPFPEYIRDAARAAKGWLNSRSAKGV